MIKIVESYKQRLVGKMMIMMMEIEKKKKNIRITVIISSWEGIIRIVAF